VRVLVTTYRDNEAFVSLIERVRSLRRTSTTGEQLLWSLLRNRQLSGAKFRRQHQFSTYILDFYCPEARLAIEVDGRQHNTKAGKEQDRIRTEYLLKRGICVLRFTNAQVLEETSIVAATILEALKEPSP
jgi:very-short-patch-repair endonuclease